MKILLIEDDQDDIELLEEALKSEGVTYEMHSIRDGAAAVDFIRSCSDCPDIIILDFNLPKVHGRDILLEIKSTAHFKDLPLLILTTSSAKEDIEFARLNGADQYIIKPATLSEIQATVHSIVTLSKK